MKLDIGEAIEKGFERTLTRSAAYLIGIFFILNLISQAMGDTVVKQMMGSGALGPEFSQLLGQQGIMLPLATGLSANLAGAISGVTALLSAIVTIGGIRLFLSEEKDSLELNMFTDNLAWILLNVIVGGLVFGIVVGIGFLAFIIPGFFLLSALYFWNFYVIDKNANFVEAMKSSWNATRNNRLRSFALLFITAIGAGIFSAFTGSILGVLGGFINPAIGRILGIIPGAVASVFTLATFTYGYRQFRDREETETRKKEDEETEEAESDEEENSEETEEETEDDEDRNQE